MAEAAQVIDFAQARAKRTRGLEPWVSKAELALHFSVSTRTVERWMRAGLPHAKRFEHSFPRFQLSPCEQWLEGR